MKQQPLLTFSTLQDAMDCARVLAKPMLPPPKPRRPEIRTQVVGGTVNWKPINKTAALVVAKAPWWAQAPISEPKFAQTKAHTKMNSFIKSTNNPMLDGKHEEKPDAVVNMELTRGIGKHGIKDVEAAEALVERAKDATAAMEYIATHFQKSWGESSDLLSSAIGELRGKRFAVESETKQMIAALSDVRKFFLDDRHDQEVRRLAEFVALCERLKDLKDCGFLDCVAETILRLEEAA